MGPKIKKKSNIFIKILWGLSIVSFYIFIVPHLPDLLQSLTVIVLVWLFFLYWVEDKKWIKQMRERYTEDFYIE